MNNENDNIEALAIPVKASPIIKNKEAKRILQSLNNPTDKSELFAKCNEMAKTFKVHSK